LSLKALISRVIEEELSDTDCFLVSVDTNQAETSLKFFIDGTDGVGIQICSRLSRKVSKVLDEEYLEETPIRYEISSPGADMPLLDRRQYKQHIGRELMVYCGENIEEGELSEVSDEAIVILKSIGKNKVEKQTLEFDKIDNSKVIISFKRKQK
jgi:ribosome maturation factor RimP